MYNRVFGEYNLTVYRIMFTLTNDFYYCYQFFNFDHVTLDMYREMNGLGLYGSSSSSLSLKCALMESGCKIGYEPIKMS